MYEPDKANGVTLTEAVLASTSITQIEGVVARGGYAHMLEPLYRVPKSQAQRDHKLDFVTMLASFKPLMASSPVARVDSKKTTVVIGLD